ncbi:hypothetical protein BDN72DRAFT_754829 [Pluteus cervinus]|uniref:Uncharacterized protein n=1 Tax=Pluteus cervinus TaxID=181527 RepID=A0ACD3BII1_9AGAR|nr:hypothetical protein BDN72DRAFT_754829 [Pluteus cervinus]
MSTWNIGMNDVTEEMQAMKDKLSSKEGRIAAQEAQISRQAAELDELRQNMNDTLHKLSREADRVIVLEQTVAQHTQELRNERLASQNINAALSAAHEKFKQQTAEYKQLEGTLQTVSYTSNGHNLRSTQLEQEKRALEARIRELESILQRQAQSLSSTPRQLPATRPRSSSLSRLQISSLERELKDTRVQLAQRDDELRSNKQRLSHLQNDLLKTENEKLFLEKRSATRIADLENLLAERAGEVQDLENDRLGNEREEELLRRIEEDDAKIAALEKLVGDTYSSGQLQDKLKRVERRLKEEAERVKQLNAERLKLQQEKEGASSDLRKTQEMLSERTVMLEELKKTWSEYVFVMYIFTLD